MTAIAPRRRRGARLAGRGSAPGSRSSASRVRPRSSGCAMWRDGDRRQASASTGAGRCCGGEESRASRIGRRGGSRPPPPGAGAGCRRGPRVKRGAPPRGPAPGRTARARRAAPGPPARRRGGVPIPGAPRWPPRGRGGGVEDRPRAGRGPHRRGRLDRAGAGEGWRAGAGGESRQAELVGRSEAERRSTRQAGGRLRTVDDEAPGSGPARPGNHGEGGQIGTPIDHHSSAKRRGSPRSRWAIGQAVELAATASTRTLAAGSGCPVGRRRRAGRPRRAPRARASSRWRRAPPERRNGTAGSPVRGPARPGGRRSEERARLGSELAGDVARRRLRSSPPPGSPRCRPRRPAGAPGPGRRGRRPRRGARSGAPPRPASFPAGARRRSPPRVHEGDGDPGDRVALHELERAVHRAVELALALEGAAPARPRRRRWPRSAAPRRWPSACPAWRRA